MHFVAPYCFCKALLGSRNTVMTMRSLRTDFSSNLRQHMWGSPSSRVSKMHASGFSLSSQRTCDTNGRGRPPEDGRVARALISAPGLFSYTRKRCKLQGAELAKATSWVLGPRLSCLLEPLQSRGLSQSGRLSGLACGTVWCLAAFTQRDFTVRDLPMDARLPYR